jgi:hypothetical protein
VPPRWIIEGELPLGSFGQPNPYPTVPVVITIRRPGDVENMVTLTNTLLTQGGGEPFWTWVLSGRPVDPGKQPSRGYREFDGGNWANASAMRAAKAALLGVSPHERLAPPRTGAAARRRAQEESDREAIRLGKVRESKAKYMRKWREANPELAREQNREAVAAHRARKKAEQAEEVPIATP